ncbi:MAG: hypothetical protein JNL49_13230 [Bacteroidia bacterium]|nr:hypothetical protein [Bacteroidia bacterium]
MIVIFNLIRFPGNILSWDVFGYYMYLPMIFIYDNWGLQDVSILKHIVEEYNSSSTLYQAYQAETGTWVMRYTMGMAVFYLPFFLIGHFIAWITGFPMDGFSGPYQVAILYGGIFYSFLGFYFLRKILSEYFNDRIVALTLLAIYFGTNYMFHTGFDGQNAMSHNYLFTAYAILIWLTIKWQQQFSFKYLVLIALNCGLIILARPSEMVSLLIPILWNIESIVDLKKRFEILTKDINRFLLLTFVFLSIFIPQMVYWKIITGDFIFNSYYSNPGEGFEFSHPFILEVLFSFRKGWLIYTPLMILALIGIVLLFLQRSKLRWNVLVFFVCNLYIVSSWSCWWYAESFSSRALVQSYVILALPLATMINFIAENIKALFYQIVTGLICLIVIFNMFQTWQYSKDIIHPSRMTWKAYKATLLKTQTPANFTDLLMVDRDKVNSDTIEITSYKKTKELLLDFENGGGNSSEQKANGKFSYVLSHAEQYTPSIKQKYREISSRDHLKIKFSAKVFLKSSYSAGELYVRFENHGKEYGVKKLWVDSSLIPTGSWQEVTFYYFTPVIRVDNDKMKLYFVSKANDVIFIDDLKAEVFERIE